MSSGKKRDAIASLLDSGCSKSEISRRLGIPRTTVRNWVSKIQLERTANDIGSANGSLDPATPEQLYTFLEQLAPINSPRPIRRKATKVDNNLAVVIGDTHFGAECQKTIEVFYNVIQELKPGKIILNGDTLDLMAVSKYPKDVRLNIDLLDERQAYHDFLSTTRDIVGVSTEIVETDANHSGNGVEGRWWRYLSDNLGALASLPDVLDKLTYGNVFIPDWANVDVVPHVELCNGNLFVMHGDVVRKMGGASARGMLDKWYTSIIMNHTHRMGVTAQHIPALGSRKGRTITVYENSCACDLKPCYASAPNWQNGFSIVAMDGDNFGVEQVMVNDGVATIATLGKTIKV